MKKILHITNWYPNKWNDVEAIFIQEQFKLFSEVSHTVLLHVEVRSDRRWFKYEKVKYSETETGFYILTRIKTFRVIEILSTLLLMWSLFRSKYSSYDLLHFHIAYPLLTYYHLWKKFIKKPVIISEHWSAYHFNFFMPLATKKLDRIKNIFKQHIPLITVSKALLEDIQTFAGTKSFPGAVIPNVIDHNVYYFNETNKQKEKPVFLIVNFWREIKNPFPMLEAFANLAATGVAFELRIGGYGPLIEEMEIFVHEHKLDKHVVLLGKIYKQEIAKEMNDADAYLFSSNYETFSVICAEALSCGCPLIGPPIPAILEYTDSNEMMIVHTNDANGWQSAILSFIDNMRYYDHKKISQKALACLSHNKITAAYETLVEKYKA